MEAIGLHDFEATAPDELSFYKGQKLKIVSMSSDENWCTALLDRSGMVPINYIKFTDNSWYHGNISREEAITVLINKHAGAFLIRDSQNNAGVGAFSLSVKSGNDVEHFRVMSDEQGKYFLWTTKFEFINELVEYHRSVSVSRKADIKLRDFSESSRRSDPSQHPAQRAPGIPPQHAPAAPPQHLPAPPPPQQPPKHLVQAIHPYNADGQDPDSLMIQSRDIIEVLEQTDAHWWLGKLGNRTAYFPASYVQDYQP